MYEKYMDMFKEELEMINEEVELTDGLYNQMKQHYDKIATSRSPGGLKFLADQSKTLVSLRNHKLSSIKDKIALKKTVIDIDLKERNFSARAEGEGDLITEFKELAKTLTEGSISGAESIEVSLEKSSKVDNNDNIEDIDALLEQQLESLSENSDNSETDDTEFRIPNNLTLCCDKDKNLYLLDESTYEIDDSIPIPETLIVKAVIVNDEESLGILENGDEIPVIEFE